MMVAALERVVRCSDACALRRSIRGRSGAGCIMSSMYGVVEQLSDGMLYNSKRP